MPERADGKKTDESRTVRLFRNGRNQAVRIPVEFEIDGSEAVMRKDGDRLIIEPLQTNRFAALLADWEPIEEEFPDIDDFVVPLDNPALDK